VAAVHIVNTLLYLMSEIAVGFPSVDVDSFVNLYVKFFWSNSFWLVLPLFVLVWGKSTLEHVYRERYSAPRP
jgi:hypothetical protein